MSLVVVHAISLPPASSGRRGRALFSQPPPAGEHPYFAEIAALQVSAHFSCAGGEVLQFVRLRPAGLARRRSTWRGGKTATIFSVGIELEGCDGGDFEAPNTPPSSIWWRPGTALPITAIAGHSDIAPGRKTDPGPGFDWAPLRQAFPWLDYPVA